MSTRANLLVLTPGLEVRQYYHHYDGYPEGLGVKLARWLFAAYEARNASRLAVVEARVKCKAAPAKRTLADCVLAELESHYRDREGAGPDDLLEPEETYAPGAVPPLHSDIEFLYVIDLSSAKRATLRCRNVRGAIWKQLYMASEQSCEAVLCDVLHNGLLLADFRYEF